MNEITPTEMVLKLIKRGWQLHERENNIGYIYLSDGKENGFKTDSIRRAFHHAFAPKKVVMDAWYCPKCGELRKDRVHYCVNGETMVPGTATFEVPEREE